MNDKNDSAVAGLVIVVMALGAAFGVPLLLIVNNLADAWAVRLLWGWFVTPLWSWPVPPYLSTVGVLLLLGLLRPSNTSKHDVDWQASWMRLLLIPPLVVAAGYLLHQFAR